MNKKFIFLAAVFMAAACGFPEPRIDASDDETMKRTYAAIEASLKEPKRTKFREAIQIINFAKLAEHHVDSKTPPGEMNRKIRETLHNKTVSEIIKEAEKIKKKALEESKTVGR